MQLDVTSALAKARAHGMCEGCGRWGRHLDAHHRQARGMGGVYSVSAERANDVRNLLAVCRECHDETEHGETWADTEAIGWRVPKHVEDARLVPALLHTVNGYGWWQLTQEAGYLWVDPESPPTVPGVTWRRLPPDPLHVPLAGSPSSVSANGLRISYAASSASG